MHLGNWLDHPVLWEFSRIGLNLAFGLYRKRIRAMDNWGGLKDSPSILDLGCGIGQYASVTEGAYLGIDLNERYIKYACRRHRRPNQVFRCTDITSLNEEKRTFDLVLMVDFLHHIPNEQCLCILTAASRLAERNILSFEPVTYQPHSLGRWIVENDRGNYVRPLEKLHALYEDSGLTIVKSVELSLGPINTRAILCRP